MVPARRRKSALLPAGPGVGHAPRPEEDWIEVPVPQIVSEETFARVQAKLDTNQGGQRHGGGCAYFGNLAIIQQAPDGSCVDPA